MQELRHNCCVPATVGRVADLAFLQTQVRPQGVQQAGFTGAGRPGQRRDFAPQHLAHRLDPFAGARADVEHAVADALIDAE